MLYFSHVNAIFQSIFTSFFIGLHKICLRAKVHDLIFIVCSLLVGIECVTDDKSKVEWKLPFLEWKTGFLVLSLVPRTLKIAF